MATKRMQDESALLRKRAPATSIEDRENQLISMAVSNAERKLRDGTASNSLILFYLKHGSVLGRLEIEKTQAEIDLLKAKKNAEDASARLEELYSGAIESMTTYGASINREADEDE